jgi:hypothetical protein
VTVAKYLLKAADLLQRGDQSVGSSTFECSLRLISGMLIMLECDQTEVFSANLERLKALQTAGTGAVVKPEEARLAIFDSAVKSMVLENPRMRPDVTEEHNDEQPPVLEKKILKTVSEMMQKNTHSNQRFETIKSSESADEQLSRHIATLEVQLCSMRDSEQAPQGATMQCQCGKVELKFPNDPRFRTECCCWCVHPVIRVC